MDTNFFLLAFCAFISAAYGLECFSCDEEDWNHRDCTHKRQPCDPFQDACTTYIRFGVPEKFNARNYRRYFISKGCDTRSGCAKRQDMMTSACTKDYYNDWACVECCEGTLCNFHVLHLAGNSIQANVAMTTLASIVVVVVQMWDRS